MSHEHITWAWKHSEARGGTLLVLLALADSAHVDNGDSCWPHQDTIGRMARLTPRQISRAVQELERLGEIAIQRTQTGNRYTILMPLQTKCPEDTHVRSDQTPMSGSNQTPMSGPRVEGEVEPEKNPDQEGQLFKVPSPRAAVWAHWCERTGTRQALDSTRKAIIDAALKIRSVEQCCKAIDGYLDDPWWQANSKREIRYALKGNSKRGIADDERIDDMIARAERPADHRPVTKVDVVLEGVARDVQWFWRERLGAIIAARRNQKPDAEAERLVREKLGYAPVIDGDGKMTGWRKAA